MRGTNLPYRRIPDNLCRYSFQKVKLNLLSPPHPTTQYHLKCKLHLVTHFQRRGRKGKNCNSSVKKPGKHHLIHVMKGHITRDAMWIPHIPRYDEIKREVDLCGILSTNPQPQSNYKKNIRQTQIEAHSTGYLVSVKTAKVMKTKERVRNYHRSEEYGETGQLNNVLPSTESMNRKRILMEKLVKYK